MYLKSENFATKSSSEDEKDESVERTDKTEELIKFGFKFDQI